MALYDLENRIRAFHEIRTLNVGTAKKPRWIINKHLGDDYAETYGNDRVYAVQPGTVIYSGFSSTFGWHLQVRLSSSVVVRYHSLKEKSVAGGTVKTGDLIGHTGKSASGASGNHVHIQVERNGVPIDPRPYIAGADFSAIPVAEPAAVAVEPLKDDDMFKLIRLADAGKKDEIWIVGTKGRAHVTSPYHKQLLERFQKGNDLLQAEIDVVVSYLSRVS